MATDQLSAAFSALGDPTRRAILARLGRGEASLNELAAPFEISVQAVSKHVKVLQQSGLISRSKDAQRRPAKLAPQGLHPVLQWVDENRGFWEARFDRLNAYLSEIQREDDNGPGT